VIARAAREASLQCLGRLKELAWAVIFVASDQAHFITGETLYQWWSSASRRGE
jgi:hypothetical protein